MKANSKQKQKQKKQKAVKLTKDQWIKEIVGALRVDDVKAFKGLAKERRWSIWDLKVSVAIDGKGLCNGAPVMAVAARVGSVKCLEELGFMGSACPGNGPIVEAFSDLYTRYEQEPHRKHEAEKLLLALLAGVIKGEKGPAPKLLVPLCAFSPQGTRFVLSSMAGRPCNAPQTHALMRSHIEILRKVFGAIAREDSVEIELHLNCHATLGPSTESRLVCGDDLRGFMRAALCCESYGSLELIFKTAHGLAQDSAEIDDLLGSFAAAVEIACNLAARPLESDLREVFENCLEWAVCESKSMELGRYLAENLAPELPQVGSAIKAGAHRGIAEVERRVISGHVDAKISAKAAGAAVRL